MKIIVLHDKNSNNPIIIRVDAITAIMKETYRDDGEFTHVLLSQAQFDVQERIDVVMSKIKNAEKKKK